MDPGGLPTDSQADAARPWLAPIVPPPPPPQRRRRPWIIGLGLGVVAVGLVVAVVWSTGSDADEEPVLVTVLREAGYSQSVTLNRRVTIDRVGTQRIVVTAADRALADTAEEFLGGVVYLDRVVLTFEFDSDRLLAYTVESESNAGPVKDEYTIIGFDMKPIIEVPDDAVSIPGSSFDR